MELEIKDLTKEFSGFTAVNEVSFSMRNGIYGLLGINGAGKTTLMRMICTLIHPSRGTIQYDGDDIFEMGGEYRRLLGYLPQEFGFYPDFNVTEYLKYIASIKGIPASISRKKVEEVLCQVGMERSKNVKMKKLSGGMKRRIGIAQAILNDPKILILDEPTAGLDPNERIRFRNMISGLSQNRIVLLSTHIVSDIECIASQIYFMKEGEIALSGSASELLESAKIRVWNCEVALSEESDIQNRFTISNRRICSDYVELRIISENKPFETAKEGKLTLEELFLYAFGEK